MNFNNGHSNKKIAFIQEFLKLQSEEVIFALENLLKKNSEKEEDTIRPMTIETLNDRIDQSEDDFSNNRFQSTEELLQKYSLGS